MLLAERELGYAQFNAFLLEEISIPRRIFVFSNDSFRFLFAISCFQPRKYVSRKLYLSVTFVTASIFV